MVCNHRPHVDPSGPAGWVGLFLVEAQSRHFAPSHPAVSAAVRGSAGAIEAASRVGESPDGALGSTDPSTMLQSSQDSAMELLALQSEIGMEQQRFTTLSNVMKARHETAKAVIGNVR